MVDVDERYEPIRTDSAQVEVGLFWVSLSLHSSNELSELLQWLWAMTTTPWTLTVAFQLLLVVKLRYFCTISSVQSKQKSASPIVSAQLNRSRVLYIT